tara:strand:- start:31 stop:240 length:210 start_codon:yes stop_codon:yes gene_type:complete
MSFMDMSFEQWMKEVDQTLVDHIGFSSEDLRDRRWRDSYDAGDTPADAIEDLVGPLDDIDTLMNNELFG